MIAGGITFICLPYANLVLISSNMIAAIAFNTFLSIKFLGEKFILKYDLPAFSLMASGGIMIVLLAATKSEDIRTPDEIVALLESTQSIIFFIITIAIGIGTVIYLRVFLKQIRRFEKELHAWAKL